MPKPSDYDKTHLRNMAAIGTRIDRIFKKASEEAAKIGVSIKDLPADRIFSFDDYPETRKQIERLMTALQQSMEGTIVNGVRSAWTLSNNKNNALAQRVFGSNVGKLTKEQERRYFSTNGDALEAFIARKAQGLNLSDRVWRYTQAFKREIELGLDLGIRSGRSAAQMSRDLRQYLQHPDKLFRRVRNQHGNLKLSKAAKEFHPGRGVYRSSYKNARRLATTETNIAYRTSDHLRWQQMDFVVGIEIKLSNNHTLNGVPLTDICDTLAGRYPKDFKFTGWHPHCRCHVVTVLKTEEEMAEDTQRILAGKPTTQESVNRVSQYPGAFREWVQEHKEQIEGSRTLPYFIKDNKTAVDKMSGIYENPVFKNFKSINAKYHSVEELMDIWDENRFLSRGNGEGYTVQGYVGELQGFNGLANCVSPSHFATLENDDNYIIFYRGFRRNAAENVDNFLHGRLYEGIGGSGNGSYFSIKKYEVLDAYTQGRDERNMITAAFDKRKVRIADADELREEWMSDMRIKHRKQWLDAAKAKGISGDELDALRDKFSDMAEIFDDFGAWATSKGYDIIYNPNDGYYVVLNRTKLILRDPSLAPKQKTPLEIAAERHAQCTEADRQAIQQAWNERRLSILSDAISARYLPEDCKAAISELRKLTSPEQFEEFNSRVATLQQAANRHAQRTPADIKAIQDRWNAKLDRDRKTRLVAENVLKLRSEYPRDVDFNRLEQLIATNNLTKMREEARNVAQAIKAVRAEEKALSDLIPDAHGWHKMFSMAELREAHGKIQSTLDYWKAKGYDLATDSNLTKLKTELEQKIKFVENPGAFKAGLKAHKT